MQAVNDRTVRDWKEAAALKADICDIETYTAVSNGALAKRIEAIRSSLQPEQRCDLVAAVCDMSALFRDRSVKCQEGLKSRALQFFIKHTPYITRSEELYTITTSQKRQIPKVLLQLQSQTFEEMLSDDVQETAPFLLGSFEGQRQASLNAFFECLQRGSSAKSLTTQNVLEVFNLAHSRRISWLENDCITNICRSLTLKNVLSFLEKGFQYHSHRIANACVAFLLENDIPKQMHRQVLATASRFHIGLLEWKLDPEFQKRVKDLRPFVKDLDGEKQIWVYTNHTISEVAQEDLAKLFCCGTQLVPIPLHLRVHDWSRYASEIADDPLPARIIELLQYYSVLSIEPIRVTFSQAEMNQLLEAADKSPQCRTLLLAGVAGAPPFKAAIAALKENRNISHMELPSHNASEKEEQALLDALAVNTNLQSLDIGPNILSNSSLVALGEVLKNNQSLQILNLASYYLTEQASRAFCEALKTNSTLHTLALQSISSACYGPLAEALTANTTLHTLLFTYANFTVNEALLDALSESRSLKMVHLGSIALLNGILSKISRIYARCPELRFTYTLVDHDSAWDLKISNLGERLFSRFSSDWGMPLSLIISSIYRFIVTPLMKLSLRQSFVYSVVDMAVSSTLGVLFHKILEWRNPLLTAELVGNLENKRTIIPLKDVVLSTLCARVAGCVAGIAALYLFRIPPLQTPFASFAFLNLGSYLLSDFMRALTSNTSFGKPPTQREREEEVVQRAGALFF